jgi:hypothetical protein
LNEYPGATIPAVCHDCGRTYLVTKKEYGDDPNAVCRDCFEAFDGLTVDQLCNLMAEDLSKLK